MRGHIDTCTRREISGWAIAGENRVAEVVIEADLDVVGAVRADAFRQDLNANCGFLYQFPSPLSNVQTVRAYIAETKFELSNSPFDLKNQLEPLTDKDLEWRATLPLPTVDQMRLIGSNSAETFVAQGTRTAKVLERNIVEFFGAFRRDLRILDFGCGVGRVLLPISRRNPAAWSACDVNAEAIAYLKSAVPDVEAVKTNSAPPLPYRDESFDCVLSISIWTHLPIEMQLPWLLEVRRILRPGGLALISTSGPYVVDVRRKRADFGWEELTPDELHEAGLIYRPYNHGGLPGIEGSYGLAAHHPDFIREVWARVMPVLTTRVRAIEAMQDLHMMTKL